MDGSGYALSAARLPQRIRSVLFDEDFGHPPPAEPAVPPEPEVIAPGPGDAALTAARAGAWAEGYAAGKAEAEEAGARALCDAAATLDAALESANAIIGQHAEANAEALAHLLMEMLAALFPELSRRYGPAEVAAVVRALLPGLAYEPAVHITLAPSNVAAMEADLARSLGEAQRRCVCVEARTGMGPGDVTVSWTRGSGRRDEAALWNDVQSALGLAGLKLPVPRQEMANVE